MQIQISGKIQVFFSTEKSRKIFHLVSSNSADKQTNQPTV